MRRLIFLLAMLFVISAHDAVAEIAGRASVIDGDTIEIRGERIRLYGIDTPESTQLCDLDGQPYRCGQQAALALADKIGENRAADGEAIGWPGLRGPPSCFVGGDDINRWMTVQGWSLAYRKYSRDYIDAEDEARTNGRGLWRGDFEPPWDWRKEHPRGGSPRP